MKKLITLLMIILTTIVNAKIVYVDKHDVSIAPSSSSSYLYLDIDQDGITDLEFTITKSYGTCTLPDGGSLNGGYLYRVQTFGSGENKIITKPDCTGDTLNYLDEFSNYCLITTGIFPKSICSGKTMGSYKLGFRLTRKSVFIYGYIDYSLTASGDIIVHGWYYNDAFNEPIIANTTAKYPYNGCIYQDTIKTYFVETIYDTIKVTKVEKIYDTIKVTKTIYKTIYDTTKITFHDTIHKTIYNTITTHITVNDTIHKTIYNTITTHEKVYDTIPVPIAVKDTLIIVLDKKIGTNLRIWPNPAQQTITMDFSDPDPTEVNIIDQAGATIVKSNTTSQIFQIDVSQWAKGTYTVYITQNGKQTTKNLQIIR